MAMAVALALVLLVLLVLAVLVLTVLAVLTPSDLSSDRARGYIFS